MKLYDFGASHNCYKVRLFLAMLGISYERQAIDLMNGENRRPDFLRLNPRGQVPVLKDEGTHIWDSTAILVYLARRYGGSLWLPDDAAGMATVTQWLAVAQNEMLYGLGRAHWLRRGGAGDLEEAMKRGRRALQTLDSRLGEEAWLALGRPTIADIACYPHAALAHEAGFSLSQYPHITTWTRAVERIDRYVDIRGNAAAPSLP
jgi:glutathione S-transferase